MLDLNRGLKESRNRTKFTSHPKRAFNASFKSYIKESVGCFTSTTMSISLVSVFSFLATEPKIPSFIMPNLAPEELLNSANLFTQS